MKPSFKSLMNSTLCLIFKNGKLAEKSALQNEVICSSEDTFFSQSTIDLINCAVQPKYRWVQKGQLNCISGD